MRWPAAEISSRLLIAPYSGEERVEHEFDAFRMGGAGVFDDFRFAVDFCFQERAFQPNLFNAACGEHAAVVHFVELVLDGAAAAVDD